MGWGAYESLKRRNIESVITDVESIDKAVKLYIAGNLPNLMKRLH
jgi:predicted Fe-Mo cluster-binding NifX family protein